MTSDGDPAPIAKDEPKPISNEPGAVLRYEGDARVAVEELRRRFPEECARWDAEHHAAPTVIYQVLYQPWEDIECIDHPGETEILGTFASRESAVACAEAFLAKSQGPQPKYNPHGYLNMERPKKWKGSPEEGWESTSDYPPHQLDILRIEVQP